MHCSFRINNDCLNIRLSEPHDCDRVKAEKRNLTNFHAMDIPRIDNNSYICWTINLKKFSL